MNRIRLLLLLLTLAACCCLTAGESALWRGIRDLSMLYNQGLKDSLMTRTMELKAIAEAKKDYTAQTMIHVMLGTISSEQGDKQTALNEFTQVADIAEKQHLLKLATSKPHYQFLLHTLVPTYAQLSLLCDELGFPERSLTYAKDGLEWAAANKNRQETTIAVAMLTEMLVKHGGDIALKVAGDSLKESETPLPPPKSELPKATTTVAEKKDADTVRQKPLETRVEYVTLRNEQPRLLWIIAAVLLCMLLLTLLWLWYTRRKKEQETRRRVDESYREGQEQERSRLAKELHDSVSNQLLAVEMKMRDEGATSKQAIKLLSESREQVRRVSHELITPEFESSTLDEVIANYVHELDGIGHCAVNYTSSPADANWKAIPPKTALDIYRIVQEAVSNAMKHGQATTVSIGMHQQQTTNSLTIIISSDGITTGQQPSKGIGLRTMRQRAEAINGQIEFQQYSFGNVVRLTLKW